jgi:SAM-dependent methyltransferase
MMEPANTIDPISEQLKRHYSNTFMLHGPSSSGVDWGANESNMLLRYKKMLEVVDFAQEKRATLLDVGCGFGGLNTYAHDQGIELEYTGVDVVANMIEWASEHSVSGKFILGDILYLPLDTHFDYVVCNGILTQKLETEASKMDAFAARLIRRLFELSRIGVAFNVMTSKVNFYSNNLYYRNPSEMLAWCQTEITPFVKLNHAYPLYEYTVYLYKEQSA